MGMGRLATFGLQKVDLLGVAKSCGIADSRAVSTMAEMEAFANAIQDISAGPRFGSVKIDAGDLERVLPTRDGNFILMRLRDDPGLTSI